MEEYCSHSECRGVGLQYKLFIEVGLKEYWPTAHPLDQCLKGLFVDVFPAELGSLFGEVDKRTGNGGIPFKELSIIAGVS